MGDVSMMTKEMIVSHKPLVEEEEEDGWRRDVDVDLTLPGPEHLDPMAEQRMVQPDYVQQDSFCWGLCCLKGCVMGVIAMAYVFIVLPTGIMFLFHGLNKRTWVTVHAGVAVLCVPTVALAVAVLLYKWCGARTKDKRQVSLARKRTLAYENPLSQASEDVANSRC